MANWLILLIMFGIINCKSEKVEPIGTGILNLETFSFDTKIADLYPDTSKIKLYENVYKIGSRGFTEIWVEKTTKTNGYFDNEDKTDVVVYSQLGHIIGYAFAKFGQQSFDAVSIVTTLDDKIAVVSATSHENTKAQSEKIIKYLTNEYGEPEQLKNNWDENALLYEWVSEKRIIRYTFAIDKATVLKVDLNGKNTSISEDDRIRRNSYIFIINPEYKNVVFPGGKNCTIPGNFVYMNEDTD